MPEWVYWGVLGLIFYGLPMAYITQIASNTREIKGLLEQIEATLQSIQLNSD